MKRVIIASKSEYKNNHMYRLADRLVKFMQDYDMYEYMDSLGIDETDEDGILSVAYYIADEKNARNILNMLETIRSDNTDVDKNIVEGLIKDISSLVNYEPMTLKETIKNAKRAAQKDGYDQVIIKEHDGTYSFTRRYKGCCPEWFGEVIGRIKSYWDKGILYAKYIPIEEDVEYEY